MARTVSVRGLTEGAVLAALVTVLALAANYIPLVGLAANFLCPIPLAVLMIRHGLRVAALATVVAIALGSAISGPVTGLLILLGFAPVGLAIGFGLRRQWSASTVVLITGGAVLPGPLLGGVAAEIGLGVDPPGLARGGYAVNKTTLAALGARRIAPLEGFGANLAFLIFFVLVSQGVLAGWVLMGKYRFPAWYRVIVILLFSSGPTGLLLFFLGLADAAFDLRRRWRPVASAPS